MNAFLLVLGLVGLLGDDAGTSVLPLLRVGTGPRACAMGESFAGLADDATAVFWNPAGLGQLRNPEFFLSHHEWFMGIRDEFASAVLPVGNGRLGIGLVYSGASGIEVWDAGNLPGDTLSASTGIASLGYGLEVSKSYSVGGTARFMYDRLGTENGTGVCADLGLLARPWSFLSAGLTAQNLGWGMKYDAGYYRLPTCFRLGIALRQEDFNLSTDLDLPLSGGSSFHIGGEYLPIRALALRAGYRTGLEGLSLHGSLSGLSLGLGVALGRFAVDYAFAPYGELGQVHRIGIRTVVIPRGFGRLVVLVIDSRTSEGVPASVKYSGILDGACDANQEGRARLNRLAEGWLRLQTGFPGYLSSTDSVYMQGDGEQLITVRLAKPGRGTIWGMVMDAATKKNIAGRVEYHGPTYGDCSVDEGNASYSLKEVPSGSYELTATGPTEDYFPQTCTVSVEPGRMVTKDFYLLRKRAVIVLKGVNFETGKAAIRPEFLANLDEAGRILQENPGVIVELGGHTDPREINTPEFPSNWELSKARAEAVRKYLIDKFKVDANRLLARGYADTRPIAANDSDEGMARNRRTEFVVLEQ